MDKFVYNDLRKVELCHTYSKKKFNALSETIIEKCNFAIHTAKKNWNDLSETIIEKCKFAIHTAEKNG